jgi:hypothetical protein
MGGNGALVLHPVEDLRRLGIVRLGDDDRILGTIEKPTMKEAEPHKRGGHRLNIAGLMIELVAKPSWQGVRGRPQHS